MHSRHDNLGPAYWLKGGSWREGADSARASAAGWHLAYNWYVDHGFRVVVVPISRSP
ncbi:MAG: hypothetical protein KDD77_18260 [Caldilineaceae bacterium]|nr:hypothetical protein [Caldilineaceae bacterium]